LADEKQDAEPEEDEPANEADETTKRFVEDLIARGEAAKPDEHGELPPGATHEIVEDGKDGVPKVKRRRFSAF